MPTKNGQYTVSSGYKTEQAKRKQARGDVGLNNRRVQDEEKMWKEVWNLNTKKKKSNMFSEKPVMIGFQWDQISEKEG